MRRKQKERIEGRKEGRKREKGRKKQTGEGSGPQIKEKYRSLESDHRKPRCWIWQTGPLK